MMRFATAVVFAMWPVLSFAQDSKCFNPETDKTIQKFLSPNQVQVLLLTPKNNENTISRKEEKLQEDAQTIKQIHEKIRESFIRDGIDPRLIYGFMIGESQADPFVTVTKADGMEKWETAGLFSLSRNTLSEMRSDCEKSKQPRLCQVEYYVNKFIPAQKKILPEVCRRKTWDKLSQAEKFFYLTQDSCRTEAGEESKRLCLTNRKYQNSGACALISEVIDWKNLDDRSAKFSPLCEDYIDPKKSLDNKTGQSSPARPVQK